MSNGLCYVSFRNILDTEINTVKIVLTFRKRILVNSGELGSYFIIMF